jgi:hypothetical protein
VAPPWVRAGRIPPWSPIVIGVSIPLHIAAFVTGVWYVDPIAYGLLAAALIPAVLAALKADRPTIHLAGSSI